MAKEKKSVVKRSNATSIIIPVILALAVAFLFYHGSQRQSQAEMRPIMVPIAIEEIREHTQITPDHFIMMDLPERAIAPGVITDPERLIGRFVGTRYTIAENSFFHEAAVTDFEDILTRIPMMLRPGYVGATLIMNLERSVANSLQDGQYVQIRFLANVTGGGIFEDVLEERIKILAVRDHVGVDVTGIDANVVPSIIVLEATEEQVSYLIRAQTLGELTILAISEEVYGDNGIEERAEVLAEILDATRGHMDPEQRAILERVVASYVDARTMTIPETNNAKRFIDSLTVTMTELESN